MQAQTNDPNDAPGSRAKGCHRVTRLPVVALCNPMDPEGDRVGRSSKRLCAAVMKRRSMPSNDAFNLRLCGITFLYLLRP
jgi:hypothetical protein